MGLLQGAGTSLDGLPAAYEMEQKKQQYSEITILHSNSDFLFDFLFNVIAVFYGLDTLTVVGIAFAAFVIGALLTGALWFIYSHTGEFGYFCQVAQHLHSSKTKTHSWVTITCSITYTKKVQKQFSLIVLELTLKNCRTITIVFK